VVGALVLALAIGTVVIETNHNGGSHQTSATVPNNPANGFGNGFGNGGSNGSGSDGGTLPGNGTWGFPNLGNGGTAGTSTATASAKQQVGIVDINTVLNYGQGRAAGTGIVLTSSGEVLTNNHVVNGSTSISVVIVNSNKTYTARVIGTDPTDDIAVIQLQNASGLQTANLGDSSKVAVADSVTGVGNAGGVGGTPSAAPGKVVALNQSITASDSDGSNSEKLNGLIQTDAPIQAGDSGGPLYSSKDEIIGVDTAASAGGQGTSGYAIPINTAEAIAKRIIGGEQSATISQGYPAFLGVELSPDTVAPTITGVVPGLAAEKAGLGEGDTITSVGGTTISTSAELSKAIAGYKPGEQVALSWTDAAGKAHSATVTLGEGPVK
jgi:S1-C subfamily serine protease